VNCYYWSLDTDILILKILCLRQSHCFTYIVARRSCKKGCGIGLLFALYFSCQSSAAAVTFIRHELKITCVPCQVSCGKITEMSTKVSRRKLFVAQFLKKGLFVVFKLENCIYFLQFFHTKINNSGQFNQNKNAARKHVIK
jgi:hypothetical protein